VITTAAIDDASITHAKLHTTMDLSSKTVTLPTLSTLNTTGNVGIGNDSPSAPLHIKKSISSTYTGGNTGIVNSLFNITNTLSTSTVNAQANIQLGIYDGTYNRVTGIAAVAESATNRKASLVFWTDDENTRSEKLRITGDGNVGIGTSSPAVALEIIGTTTSGIRIKNNALHSNGFNIYVDSSTDTAVLNNPFSGPMLFETANTERMRIDGGGNVGIGLTSNFGSIFHVNSEMSLGPDNNNRMIISSTSGGVGSIGTIEGGTASFSTMTFKGGNVGIGTTNPTSKLHVDGAMVSTTLTQGSGELQIQGYGSTGYINMNGSGSLRFRMGSSYTEHMSLAPGGQLLASAAGRYTGLPSNSWVTFGRLYSAQSTPLNIKVIVGHNSSGGYNEFTNDTYAYNVAAGTVVTIGNTTGGYTCQIRKIKRIGGQNGIPGAHYNGGDGGWEYQVARNQAYSMSVGFHVMGATTGWTWTI